jgi:hypothetical protein
VANEQLESEAAVRFLERGADIPDDLIRAVRDGRATFLCGAGVSLRVELPLFKQLTEQVYERLGETSDDEPAERIAIAEKQYDRALRSLEKRTHRPGTVSRVRGDADGGDAFSDEDAAEGGDRDGAARARLQPHARDEHRRYQTAPRGDPGLRSVSCCAHFVTVQSLSAAPRLRPD